MGNRRNESVFHPKNPDELVTMVIRVPRIIKDKIRRQAATSGHTISEWASSALEQAAVRDFRVYCFHPSAQVVNGWCFQCRTWIGGEDGGEADGQRAADS